MRTTDCTDGTDVRDAFFAGIRRGGRSHQRAIRYTHTTASELRRTLVLAVNHILIRVIRVIRGEVTSAFPRRVFRNSDRCAKDPRSGLSCFDGLESFLELDVPEAAFDGGNRFVVAVLESAGHKRRVFVEHILHPECDRRVVKPPSPVSAAVFRCGNG
jgi:hypothetical protein